MGKRRNYITAVNTMANELALDSKKNQNLYPLCPNNIEDFTLPVGERLIAIMHLVYYDDGRFGRTTKATKKYPCEVIANFRHHILVKVFNRHNKPIYTMSLNKKDIAVGEYIFERSSNGRHKSEKLRSAN